MALTPEEIAERAFTPSADGYHQAEVRTFLDRIAAEVRALQAALPEGRAELVDVIATLTSREPRLARLETELDRVSAELTAATKDLRQAQADVGEHLVMTRRLATEQLEAIEALVAQSSRTAALVDGPVAQVRNPAASTPAPATTSPGSMPPATVASAPVAAGQPPTASPAAGSMASAPADTHAPWPASMSPATDPIDGANLDSPQPAAPKPPETNIDSQPLFSDRANDLLDGVLDDVMGNLNDQGRPKS